MPFTRQFRALLKLSCLWAVPWVVLGAIVAVARWVNSPDLHSSVPSLGGWVLDHALGYGSLGLISGLYLGLLLARLERGRQVESVSPRRVVLWSVIAGAVPPFLFAGLGLIFGAPAIVYLPLVGLGILSAGISGAIATTALAAVRRRALADTEDRRPALPRP
jgi:hypothetical protein